MLYNYLERFRVSPREFKRNMLGYLLLIPSLTIIITFAIYPAINSFVKSFQMISPFGEKTIFVGLDNYIKLFNSASYRNSIKVTFIYSAMLVPSKLLISLGIALLLNRKLRGMGFYRTFFFLPLAISPAMAAVTWLFLYNPNLGFLNYLLSFIGIQGPNWLTDSTWALISITIATVWKGLGFNIIVFLAGLQNIPKSLYDSAAVDGAGLFQKFRHVTLPLLSPTFFFLFVVSIIRSFRVFGPIDVLTEGGPGEATNLLVYKLYQDAFVNFRFGYATTQAVILFVIILLLTAIQFRFLGRRVHYQ